MIKLSGFFTGFSSRSDGSAGLRFATQELSPDDFAKLKEAHNKFGWLLFAENDITSKDIPQEDAEDKSKTPSKRLRAALFVYYKQKGIKEDFDVWYRGQMEKIIEKVKSNLD